MIETSQEHAAISAAQPEFSTAHGAYFRVIQVLSPALEWCTKGVQYIEFTSKFLDFDVRVGYSIDDEEEYPDVVLLEVHTGRAELTQHLNKAALDQLEDELADAVHEQDARELRDSQERRAESRKADRDQLELVL